MFEFIRGLFDPWIEERKERESIERSFLSAGEKKREPLACKDIRYTDVFFDLDDTLISGFVGKVQKDDAFEMLMNLAETKKECGYPRLHVVSVNPKDWVHSALERHKMLDYFDSVSGTASDKSGAIVNVLRHFGGKASQAVMVGHDLEYDFAPIRKNRETFAVDCRLIEDRISQFDGKLTPEDKEKLLKAGFCTIKSIAWPEMKRVLVDDDCIEQPKEELEFMEEVVKKRQAAFWNQYLGNFAYRTRGKSYEPFGQKGYFIKEELGDDISRRPKGMSRKMWRRMKRKENKHLAKEEELFSKYEEDELEERYYDKYGYYGYR